MQSFTLPMPGGYVPRTSPVVSTTAAQLDALLANLTARIEGAPPEHLEWQIRPGTNTIGMLLAHMAVCEAYWVEVVGRGIESEAEANDIVLDIVGIRMEEDGMPLAENGGHPISLSGKTASEYLEMLVQTRTATHRALRRWKDSELEVTRRVDGRGVSIAWLLYHLVEHFAHHLGQIAQLDSLRRRMEGH